MADALRQRPVRQHDFQLAVAHGLGADGFRQHGDAVAVLDHALQQREVEAGHARLQVHAAHLAVRTVQLPALACLVLADAHRDVVGQVIRILGAAGAVQVLRAGDQQFLHLAEAAHHQRAVIVQARTHAQGDVVALVDDVHPAVADVQLQPDLGVHLEEFRQQPRQLHLGQRHRHAGTHQPTRFGAQPVDHLTGGLGLGQHGLGVAVHAHADIGDREAARGALQQAHAQVGLQLADAPAQARLGDAQCTFGRSESAVVNHHREVVQVIQILHVSSLIFRTIGVIQTPLSRACNNPSFAPCRGDTALP
jgi:hypothetical protein